MTSVRWSEGAEVEFIEAASWYEGRQVGLGARFITAVDVALQSIEAAPSSYPRWDPKQPVRKALVRDAFPYAVIYEVAGSEVFVVAIAHTGRRPGYWAHRGRP